MDSLTQIVLGAAVGEAALGKKVGNKAALYGAIAGTIPDLDVLSSHFVDTVTAIEWHRSFTHSLLFAVIFGPTFGYLISLYEKKASWKQWSWLMFLGFFTHALLDAFTTWGTQLFWPFDIKIAFKSVFVIDPLYTIPFLFFLIWALLLPKKSPKRRKLNWLGIGCSSAYLILGLIFKQIGVYQFEKALKENQITYSSLQVRPAPFTTLLWSANVETEHSFLVADYSFFDRQPIQFKAFKKNHHLLGDLKFEDKVERLIAISESWYTISKIDDMLIFNDLRFGLLSFDLAESRFAFAYQIKPQSGGVQIEELPKKREDAKQLLKNWWGRVTGN
ncbi:MAG: metal-dependent hydrolase [Bacteroidota bacterium]